MIIDCRFFNGYKPCGKHDVCDSLCPKKDIVNQQVLLVHLGALGAVVRSTSLLSAIKRKYPKSFLTWVTDAPAEQLLKNHPQIDRVLTTHSADLLSLSALEFEAAFIVDKATKAIGVLKQTTVKKIFGFKTHPSNGSIVPATSAAEELWSLGTDNHKKFFVNKKSEAQLICEALELPYQRDEYSLPLNKEEDSLRQQRNSQWRKNKNQVVIGLNTGCSNAIPYKKWTVEFHRQFIKKLIACGYENIVLLGGKEDSQRNKDIAQGLNVIESPTDLGLRDGLISVAACDLIVTGDSLGMHMAISQKKYTVAWFGPTCAHEIDLYDRGQALLAKVDCGPCWRRFCDKTKMCYDQVDENELILAIDKGCQWYQKNNPSSLSKQLS